MIPALDTPILKGLWGRGGGERSTIVGKPLFVISVDITHLHINKIT